MTVEVLLFAAARESAGLERIEMEVPEGTTVAGLFRLLAEAYPALAPVLGSCRAAVDEHFAAPDAALADGSVVAVLPPVSGG